MLLRLIFILLVLLALFPPTFSSIKKTTRKPKEPKNEVTQQSNNRITKFDKNLCLRTRCKYDSQCRKVGNKGRGRRSVRLRGVPGCAKCAVREFLEVDGGYCTPHRHAAQAPPSYEEIVRQFQQPLVYRPPDEALTLPLLGNPDQMNFQAFDVIEQERRFRVRRRSSAAPFFGATIAFIQDQGMCRGTCKVTADCNKEQTNFKKICTCLYSKCVPTSQRPHVWQLDTDLNGNYIPDVAGTCYGPCTTNAECEKKAKKLGRKAESCQCVHGTCKRFIYKYAPLYLAAPLEGRSAANNYMATEVANNLIKEFEMQNYLAKKARNEANKEGDSPEAKRFKANRERFNNRDTLVPAAIDLFVRIGPNQKYCRGECVIDVQRCSNYPASHNSDCRCENGVCVLYEIRNF